jgi:site-specific recombinase XerD
MTENEAIPTLLEFMLGEKAATAERWASERLRAWCAAFDEWLAERKGKNHRATYTHFRKAWKRLLGRCGKAPWEVTVEDVQGLAQWLEGQGYGGNTIRRELGCLERFYEWCGERGIDPQCEADFNPAGGVRKPRKKNYSSSQALRAEEARGLLAVLKRDPCSLSRRDYAFFLARLEVGVPLRDLKELKWGQIRQEGGEAWVDWGGERGVELLPAAAWEAMVDYLEAAGRLAGMRAEAYVFAPLQDILGKGEKAEDWNEGRPLSNEQIERILKIYGRQAGIAERKLTLLALRHTAALLRVEAGDSAEEIQAFMGRSELYDTRRYLRRMEEAMAREGEETEDGGGLDTGGYRTGGYRTAGQRTLYSTDEARGAETAVRRRTGGHPPTHGFTRKSQPPEEVRAMLAEGKRGLEDEIDGMRWLGRRLLAMPADCNDPRELEDLMGAYGLAAARTGELLRYEKELGKRSKLDGWVEEIEAAAERMAAERGGEMGEGERKAEEGEEETGDGGWAVGRLVEEIAALRVVLRRSFGMAMASQETKAILRLVELYGRGCMRLARLLKLEGGQASEREEQLREGIQVALKEVAKDLGL